MSSYESMMQLPFKVLVTASLQLKKKNSIQLEKLAVQVLHRSSINLSVALVKNVRIFPPVSSTGSFLAFLPCH